MATLIYFTESECLFSGWIGQENGRVGRFNDAIEMVGVMY